MQIAIGIAGIIALISSILYLFFPDVVSFLNSLGKEIAIDVASLLDTNRVAAGIFYFLGGIFMVYVGFFYH